MYNNIYNEDQLPEAEAYEERMLQEHLEEEIAQLALIEQYLP